LISFRRHAAAFHYLLITLSPLSDADASILLFFDGCSPQPLFRFSGCRHFALHYLSPPLRYFSYFSMILLRYCHYFYFAISLAAAIISDDACH